MFELLFPENCIVAEFKNENYGIHRNAEIFIELQGFSS